MPILIDNLGAGEAYINEDISFFNINQARQAALYFDKHKHYEYPPPKPKNEKDDSYYQRFMQSAQWPEYKAYWDEEERRCNEGIIIPGSLKDGKLQDIHITGHHYSYLNYKLIAHESGSHKSGENIHKNIPSFARKVGRVDNKPPDFWDGDYHYYHAVEIAKKFGMNLVVDKTRQVGYSQKNSMLATDQFEFYPYSTTLLGGYTEAYVNDKGAILDMAKENVMFLNAHTDFKKNDVTWNNDEIISGYRYAGENTIYGYKSKILTAVFRTNTGAARGKKGELCIFDEVGKWPNLLESVIATNKILREGNVTTGIMILFGTGGGKRYEDFQGFKEIFYRPLDYWCIPFKNVWDKGLEHTNCGFFHPRYWNFKPYYDENGNSDVATAMKVINEEREVWKNSGKLETLRLNKSETPICPSESFNFAIDNIYMSEELELHSQQIELNNDYKIGKHGRILKLDGKLVFRTNEQLKEVYQHKPIESISRKADDDVTGCVTIYDYPFINSEGRIPENMYIICHDPYATDTEAEDLDAKYSLGATYVYEVTNKNTAYYGDRLVAKFLGRSNTTDEYNEQLFMLAEYYGISPNQLWYEADRGNDVKSYAKRLNKLAYLCHEAQFDSTKGNNDSKTIYYGISINRNNNRKKYAASTLKEWLYTIRGYKNDGRPIYNFHYIFDPFLIQQLKIWNMDGNFDSVSALFILMFAIKELEAKNIQVEDSAKLHRKNRDSILNPEYLSKMIN